MTAWASVALLMGAAFVFGAVVVRVAASRTLRGAQRPLLATAALVWLSAIAFSAPLVVLQGTTPVDRLGHAGLVALGLVCAMPAIRDLLAVLSLTSSGRLALHDHIRTGAPPVEGRVVAVGLRRTVVETEDAVEVSIPNRRLDANAIHGLARASDRSGVPVELDLPFEDGMDPREICSRLFEAAMLSPYAVPGRAADVQLVAPPTGQPSVRLRGWVSHAAFAGRYRGDVLHRMREMNTVESDRS